MRRLVWMCCVAVSCGQPEGQLSDPNEVMFRRLDQDGSGRITVDEIRDREADELVKLLDLDGSGDLNLSEVRQTLSKAPKNISRAGRKLGPRGKSPDDLRGKAGSEGPEDRGPRSKGKGKGKGKGKVRRKGKSKGPPPASDRGTGPGGE